MRLRTLVAAFVLIASSLSAKADEITYKIDVFADVGSAPYFYGDYIITLDPTSYYLNETAGITVAKYNFALTGRTHYVPPSITAFNYSPSTQNLVIGGLDGGVDTLSATTTQISHYPNDPYPVYEVDEDYILSLQLSDHPMVNSFMIAAPLTYKDFRGGTVSETQLTSVTPEPSSIVLLGTGLLSMAGVLKRRFSKAV